MYTCRLQPRLCVPVSGAVYLFAWQILRVRVQGTGKMFCEIRNATFENAFENGEFLPPRSGCGIIFLLHASGVVNRSTHLAWIHRFTPVMCNHAYLKVI